MKTISFQQPYAELILQGRKTLDLRTYTASFRGRFALHASQTVKEDVCALYGLNPADLPRGAIVGTVELTDTEPLTPESYEAHRDEHLRPGAWKPGLVGWALTNPQRLTSPVPYKGKQGWFNVPDALFAGADSPAAVEPAAPAPRQPIRHADFDPAHPFELVIEPRDETSYALAIYQWPVKANGIRPRARKVITLAGVNLQAVADHVLDALKSGGYKTTDLSPRRRAPFQLSEEPGVRLALLFLTVAPLSRLDRIETISRELRAMPVEEAYYWYSKCTAPDSANRAQQALRVLLAVD